MRVKAMFAWYDCWIGLFWDQRKRRLYVFPLPMIGLMVQFGPTRKSDSTDSTTHENPKSDVA